MPSVSTALLEYLLNANVFEWICRAKPLSKKKNVKTARRFTLLRRVPSSSKKIGECWYKSTCLTGTEVRILTQRRCALIFQALRSKWGVIGRIVLWDWAPARIWKGACMSSCSTFRRFSLRVYVRFSWRLDVFRRRKRDRGARTWITNWRYSWRLH